MIFSGDCGRFAAVRAGHALAYRLRVGHFWILAIRPLIDTQVGSLAIRWLGVGWNLGVFGLKEDFYSPMTRAATVAAASSERAGITWE